MGRPPPDDDPTRRAAPPGGPGSWDPPDQGSAYPPPGGEIACTTTPDGLVITWTDRRFRIDGVVTAPGSTRQELAERAAWWRGNSDVRR